MRPLSLALLTAGLIAAMPALAQDTWTNTDPNCAPEFYSGAMAASQAAQEASKKDAEAVNDYYKKIKEGVSNSDGKMLSCVDVSWPDLPFNGMLPMVEEFIKEVGDEAVAEGCDQMRDQVREAESLFNTDNLKSQALGAIRESTGYTGGLPGGGQGNQPTMPNVPGIPTPNNPVAPPENGGGFGGLIDLFKPKPRPPGGITPVEP